MSGEINLEALKTVAYAYFDRGSCVQYDQLCLNRSGSVRAERRQPGREPEYATADCTLHLDCSSYAWSVYYETFGIKLPALLTESMINLEDMRVFYYKRTGRETPEKKKKILEKFQKTLLPGDAVVTRNRDESNGHIMVFVGDNKVLHCTYFLPGGDYDYKEKKDKYESYGAIMEFKAQTFWTEGADRYLFGDRIGRFAIIRPYGEKDKPTAKAQARAKSLFRVAVFKTCTPSRTRTVRPGGEIRYSVTVKNCGQEAKKIKLTDEPPRGATGAPVKEEFYLAPLESRTVNYSFKATGEEEIIRSKKTRVNGVLMNETATFCRKGYTDKQKAAIKDACRTCRGADWEFVKAVYKKALSKTLPDKDAEEALNAYLEPSDVDTLVRFKKTDMTVPGFYGGKNMQTYKKDKITRTREIRPGDFEVGDVLVYSDEKDVHALVCGGEWELYGGDKVYKGEDALKITESLLGQFAFFVLRP